MDADDLLGKLKSLKDDRLSTSEGASFVESCKGQEFLLDLEFLSSGKTFGKKFHERFENGYTLLCKISDTDMEISALFAVNENPMVEQLERGEQISDKLSILEYDTLYRRAVFGQVQATTSAEDSGKPTTQESFQEKDKAEATIATRDEVNKAASGTKGNSPRSTVSDKKQASPNEAGKTPKGGNQKLRRSMKPRGRRIFRRKKSRESSHLSSLAKNWGRTDFEKDSFAELAPTVFLGFCGCIALAVGYWIQTLRASTAGSQNLDSSEAMLFGLGSALMATLSVILPSIAKRSKASIGMGILTFAIWSIGHILNTFEVADLESLIILFKAGGVIFAVAITNLAIHLTTHRLGVLALSVAFGHAGMLILSLIDHGYLSMVDDFLQRTLQMENLRSISILWRSSVTLCCLAIILDPKSCSRQS